MRERENKDAFKKAEKTEKKLRVGRGGIFALLFLASIFVLPLNAFAAQSIYTDMFVMSYNQGASEAAQKIFSQMLGNMFFNAGPQADGGLEDLALGHCSEATTTDENFCYTDLDCERRNIGYCDSSKAKVTRDTKRLADLQDIQIVLQNYYTKLRCSNDFARGCRSNADCYGGGACGNFKPKLTSGTYVTGKTNSAWPSWQATLAKEIGVVLPVDPINKLFTTIAGAAATCSDPFDPKTCWDADAKSMPMNGDDCNIDQKSSVYLYESPLNISSARMYIKGEIDPSGAIWQPAWASIPNLSYNPFLGYITEGICKTMKETCGDGNIQPGEDCTNCVFDAGCAPDQKCVKDAINGWNCVAKTHCGDNDIQAAYSEECDLGPFNTNVEHGCTPFDCKIVEGWKDDGSGGLVTICGDTLVKGSEQCDLGDPTSPGGKNGVAGSGCTDICMCDIANGYDCTDPNHPVKLCGNHILNIGETCDDGNTVSGDGCSADCKTCEQYYNCTDDPTDPTKDCGNGVINSGENCDDNNTVSGDGCSADCQTCEQYYNCDDKIHPTAICGDGHVISGVEQCDFTGYLPGNVTTNPTGCSNTVAVPKCCNFPTDTNKCKWTQPYIDSQTCTFTSFTVNGTSGTAAGVSLPAVASPASLSISWAVGGTTPQATITDSGGTYSSNNPNGTLSGTITNTRTITISACGGTVVRSVTVNVTGVVTPVCELNILKATNLNTGASTVVSGATSAGTLSAYTSQSIKFEWTILNPSGSFEQYYDTPIALPVITSISASGNQTIYPSNVGNYTFKITPPAGCGTAKTISIAVSTGAPVTCNDGICNPLTENYATCSADCFCGNGAYDGSSSNEDCDCSSFALQTGRNYTYSCNLAGNISTLPLANSLPYNLTTQTYRFCNASCLDLGARTGNFCGDGLVTSIYEDCDWLNNKCCTTVSGSIGCRKIINATSWDGTTKCDINGAVCAPPKVLNASGVCVDATLACTAPLVKNDAGTACISCSGADWSYVYASTCTASPDCRKTATATRTAPTDLACDIYRPAKLTSVPCNLLIVNDGCCSTVETWANETACGLKDNTQFAMKIAEQMWNGWPYGVQCSGISHYLVPKLSNKYLEADWNCNTSAQSNMWFKFTGASPVGLSYGDTITLSSTGSGQMKYWPGGSIAGVIWPEVFTFSSADQARTFQLWKSTSAIGSGLVTKNAGAYLKTSSGKWLDYRNWSPNNTFFETATAADAVTVYFYAN